MGATAEHNPRPEPVAPRSDTHHLDAYRAQVADRLAQTARSRATAWATIPTASVASAEVKPMADEKLPADRPILKDAVGNKFLKGTRPGPGRPKGVRQKASKMRAALRSMSKDPDAAIDSVLDALLRQAQRGDVASAELFLKHVSPAQDAASRSIFPAWIRSTISPRVGGGDRRNGVGDDLTRGSGVVLFRPRKTPDDARNFRPLHEARRGSPSTHGSIMTTSNIRAMRKELHQLLGRAAKVSEITVINVINEGDEPEDSDLTSGRDRTGRRRDLPPVHPARVSGGPVGRHQIRHGLQGGRVMQQVKFDGIALSAARPGTPNSWCRCSKSSRPVSGRRSTGWNCWRTGRSRSRPVTPTRGMPSPMSYQAPSCRSPGSHGRLQVGKGDQVAKVPASQVPTAQVGPSAGAVLGQYGEI